MHSRNHGAVSGTSKSRVIRKEKLPQIWYQTVQTLVSKMVTHGTLKCIVASKANQMFQKSTIFWDITPCSPLKVSRRYGGTYRLHHRGRRISGAGNSRWQANPTDVPISSSVIMKLTEGLLITRRAIRIITT
jgi:hypothetical protein